MNKIIRKLLIPFPEIRVRETTIHEDHKPPVIKKEERILSWRETSVEGKAFNIMFWIIILLAITCVIDLF